MENQHIYFGIKNLKKNQRRGTMREALEHKQVRYYGVKKFDKKIFKEYGGREKVDLDKLYVQAVTLRGRVKGLNKKIESEKNIILNNQYKKELETTKQNLSNLQKKIKEIENKDLPKQNIILDKRHNIIKSDNQIKKTENQIKKAENEIKKAENEIKKSKLQRNKQLLEFPLKGIKKINVPKLNNNKINKLEKELEKISDKIGILEGELEDLDEDEDEELYEKTNSKIDKLSDKYDEIKKEINELKHPEKKLIRQKKAEEAKKQEIINNKKKKEKMLEDIEKYESEKKLINESIKSKYIKPAKKKILQTNLDFIERQLKNLKSNI